MIGMKHLILILLIAPLILVGQKRKKQRDTSVLIIQPGRIEFGFNNSYSEFFVVPGEKDGLLVVEETKEKARNQAGYVWKLHKIDTSFNVKSSESYVISAEGGLLGHEYVNGNFFLLFNKRIFRSDELFVCQLSTDTGNILTYDIKTVFPIDVSHFETVGNTILLSGYANYRPVVLIYDLEDKIPRVVPGFYDNKNDILDLVVDKKSDLFTVILSERMRNKKYTVRVKTFTATGDLIQDNIVNPGEKKSLIDAASTTFSGGLQYLAGSHSRKSLLYSQGVYLSKFINGVQQHNKYYPFAELNNFFGYLKPKREERIKNRIGKKKNKGKIKRFNYRLLVHDIIQRDDEYIMIAEAYYPRYSYSGGNSFNNYDYESAFRRGVPGNPFFLGYKYTHAVVVGFDRNCNVLWDNTFKIEDIQTYSLEENVAVSAYGDKVVLMYLEENEIRSKVIKGNEILEGRAFNPVRLSFNKDEVKSSDPDIEGLKKWFDGTLFAYGVQTIYNKNGIDGKINRKVFYINKIQYK